MSARPWQSVWSQRKSTLNKDARELISIVKIQDTICRVKYRPEQPCLILHLAFCGFLNEHCKTDIWCSISKSVNHVSHLGSNVSQDLRSVQDL